VNKKQILVWLVLMGASFFLLRNISNGVFGLLDNGPMMLLMLLGLDPDGWIGEKLEKYKLDPVYVACCVAMLVNTLTDGIAAAGDPESSLFGVVLGCLVPIAFLPVVWRLRNASR
jgi:uncharacterized membrane protein YccC